MRQGLVNARVTFRSSPIHVLERFAFADARSAMSEFRARSGLDECVIVQTCNRVELYGAAEAPDEGRIRSTWASLSGLPESDFAGNLEFGEGRDVLEHLLRLTSGLDSMIVGEEQILGQVRDAIAAARAAGASGRRLNTLFDRAVRAGTRIRGETGIGRGGVSVGSMAVRLAEENVDGMRSRRLLMIGTGQVSSLVAKALLRRGYAFGVASRTVQRSRSFCEAMGGGTPVPFTDALAGFGRYDVIFVATAAPYYMVTYDRMAAALAARRGGGGEGGGGGSSSGGSGGMMILDLSNPRTVDERVATLGGVKLMNLDQIAEMVDKNMRGRIGKAGAAEGAVREELPAIESAMSRLDAEPIAREAFRRAEEVRERELRKALQMLGEDDPDRVRIIDGLTRAVVEGVMSVPMNNLRRASEEGDGGVTEAALRLFGGAQGGGGGGGGAARRGNRRGGSAGE